MQNHKELVKKYKEKIWRFLVTRPRSKKEVRERLILYFYKDKEEVDQNVVNETIKELVEQKCVDDESFTKWFFESRLNKKNKSFFQIKAELAVLGITKEVIDSYTEGREEQINKYESETIERLLQKHATKFRKISDIYKRKQHIYNFFLLRGFKDSNINDTLEDKAKNI